jgi:hypothetical protein
MFSKFNPILLAVFCGTLVYTTGAQIVSGSGTPGGPLPTLDDIRRITQRQKDLIDAEKKRVVPSEADRRLYKDFLRQPKTGITRLVMPVLCSVPLAEVLRDREKYAKQCPSINLFTGGFSFRKNEYAIPNLADVVINKNVIYSAGLLAQAIMTNLGDTPLDGLSLQSPGVKFLVDFVPEITATAIDQQSVKFNKGYTEDKFTYARGFKIAENTSFALRVIAYRANPNRPMPSTAALSNKDFYKMDSAIRPSGGATVETRVDPLFGDERKDVIVAFRIIRVGADGSVTLIWRELQRKDAPKAKAK